MTDPMLFVDNPPTIHTPRCFWVRVGGEVTPVEKELSALTVSGREAWKFHTR